MTPRTFQPDAIVEAATGQVSADLAGETLILDLRTGGYFSLQGVGARLWQLLRQPKTVSELESALLAEFDVPVARCQEDLDILLQGLSDRGLVAIHGRNHP